MELACICHADFSHWEADLSEEETPPEDTKEEEPKEALPPGDRRKQ
jgi:hypothetical protein